jgi:catechol-2,3-dioxygenase
METVLEIPDPVFEPRQPNAVNKPVMLSHGTLQVRNLKESRRFYEEFLGLECVRQGPRAIFVRCGIKFHIVAWEAGEKARGAYLHQHWGLELRTKEEIDQAHARAKELKNEYKIGQIQDPEQHHGVYSFYFEDLDGNWWEFQYYDGCQHDDAFDFGDRFGQESTAEATAKPAS